MIKRKESAENTKGKGKNQSKKLTKEGKLKLEIEELNIQVAELKDKYLRLIC